MQPRVTSNPKTLESARLAKRERRMASSGVKPFVSKILPVTLTRSRFCEGNLLPSQWNQDFRGIPGGGGTPAAHRPRPYSGEARKLSVGIHLSCRRGETPSEEPSSPPNTHGDADGRCRWTDLGTILNCSGSMYASPSPKRCFECWAKLCEEARQPRIRYTQLLRVRELIMMRLTP